MGRGDLVVGQRSTMLEPLFPERAREGEHIHLARGRGQADGRAEIHPGNPDLGLVAGDVK